ncbi:hypothetical protein HDU96_006600 [Phlyctochytrium bullatum]|nr:hypothetical protein HDU96_006600 [Phlyctochytrium bullatum]
MTLLKPVSRPSSMVAGGSPLLKPATDIDDPRPYRASVVSTAASLGLKYQNPIRLPLAAFIVAIVILVAGLVGGLVGYLTISDALSTINDITLQMRLAILEKTVNTVNTTLENAVATLRAKVSDAALFDWMNAKKWDDGFLNYPEILGIYSNAAASIPYLSTIGLIFYPNELGNSSGFIFNGDPRQPSVVFFTTNSTTLTSVGKVYAIIAVSNFRPILTPKPVALGAPIAPHFVWPLLKRNGIVPGKPFFADLTYVAQAQSLFIPMLWPVWRDLPLGVPGPGSYWATHVAAISLDGLEEFLRTLKVTQNGLVAIVEGATGLMVSTSAPNASWDASLGARFPAKSAPVRLIAAAVAHLADEFGNGTIISIPTDRRRYDLVFPAFGDDVLVNAQWFVDDEKGLKWLVMVIIPSNDFLASIKRSITRTIVSVSCICLAGVSLAILLSWGITAPLNKLVKAMVEATSFDFSALGEGYLSHRSHVREIGLLQGVFNEMLVNFANAIRVNKSLNTHGAVTRKAPLLQSVERGRRTSQAKSLAVNLSIAKSSTMSDREP